jgi:hypothetical protein
VGHTFTPQNVLHAQTEREENALWSAVAAMEESAILIRRLLPNLSESTAARLKGQIDRRLGLAKEARNIIERLDSLQIN